MKKAMLRAIAIAIGAVAISGCGSDDGSDGTGPDQLAVTDAWTRVTTATQADGAAYLTIESPGADVLTDVSVPSSVAGDAQLHETTDSGSDDSAGSMDSTEPTGSADDGMMGMQEVDEIDIPAGEAVMLEPGGYHIMLMDLAKPIETGDTVPVTLEFENAGEVQVDATGREE